LVRACHPSTTRQLTQPVRRDRANRSKPFLAWSIGLARTAVATALSEVKIGVLQPQALPQLLTVFRI
jgi:hypothetical protein